MASKDGGVSLEHHASDNDASINNHTLLPNWLSDPDLDPEMRRAEIEEMVDDLIRPYRLGHHPPLSHTHPAVGSNSQSSDSMLPLSKGNSLPRSDSPAPGPGPGHALTDPVADTANMDMDMDRGVGFDNCDNGGNWCEDIPTRPAMHQDVVCQQLQGEGWINDAAVYHGYPGPAMGDYNAVPWDMSVQRLSSFGYEAQSSDTPEPLVHVSEPEHGSIGNPQPVQTIPRPSSRHGMLLGALETADLSSQESLFYFGVLLTVEGVTPQFQYVEDHDRKWRVRLVFGTFVVAKETAYETKFEARADACREALDILKSRYRNRTVPAMPGEGVLEDKKWIWSMMLQGIINPYFVTMLYTSS